jgi:two-component sensor histidine kinase
VSHSLLQALVHAGISVYRQDADLRVTWAENLPSTWAGRCRPGASDWDFLPQTEADRLEQAKHRVLSSGEAETCEIRVQESDGPHWFDVWLDRCEDERSGVSGVLTTAVETTEQKQREQILKSLLREVSHRSKNLLAIIQSIATQTGRYSGTIESFLSRFRGRLQSLAASQDLVTLSNWRGADLSELVANQVGRYAATPRDSIRFEGENPYLNPNAALHVGLALHELAVNSISYGALSQPRGSVSISAAIVGDGSDEKKLVLAWNERIPAGAPKVAEKRFGSVALERVVPASLRGTAEFLLDGDSLNYRLSVPLGAVGAEHHST